MVICKLESLVSIPKLSQFIYKHRDSHRCLLDRIHFAMSQDDENLSVSFLSGFHAILL